MVEITTIGLDIANVFQVHGVGAAGQVAVIIGIRVTFIATAGN